MAVLVTYASKHGATEGIARFIAERLRERGMDVEARPVDAVGEIGHPDAIVLGSAVYAGSWMKQAKAFVEDHAEELSRVPVWLFSSGPVGDTKDVGVADEQLEELKVLSARDHHLFAGALDKSKLSFIERQMVKAVKAPEGDFRNWDEISAWVDQVAEALV
jgi:menaquinone-dependent protoporphyrinogen oxidase